MREPVYNLAFAGDWHGNTSWAINCIYALEEQANVDTILHLGDYGYTFSADFVTYVEKALAECNIMLYFVDGNHDFHKKIWSHPKDEDGLYVISEHVRGIPRGHRWQWWGLTFLGLGGAHSVDRPHRTPNKSWWKTEWITPAQHAKAQEGGPVDVMIAHDCPSGVTIPGVTREDGLKYFEAAELDAAEEHRVLLRETVDAVKPKLYVHGHYHVLYGTIAEDGCRYVGLNCDNTHPDANLWVVRVREDLVPYDD